MDLLTKIFLYGTSSDFLPHIIGIRYAPLNTGAAWSFLSGHTWLFCLLAFVFIAGAIFFDIKFKGKKGVVYSLGIGFLLGGTIGNLIDRLVLSGVRDFLFFEFWETFPTFNFADVSLTVGCILIAIYVLFLYKPKEKQPKVVAGVNNVTVELKECEEESAKNGNNDINIDNSVKSSGNKEDVKETAEGVSSKKKVSANQKKPTKSEDV